MKLSDGMKDFLMGLVDAAIVLLFWVVAFLLWFLIIRSIQ